MFGLSLLIIVSAALVGTGLAALGLRLFLRMVEPTAASLAPTEQSSLAD
jgi:hypothetical protein